MMIKRSKLFLLAALLVFSMAFAACDSKKDSSDESESTVSESKKSSKESKDADQTGDEKETGDQTEEKTEENASNGVLDSDQYALIYDESTIPESFWNASNSFISSVTNRTYYEGQYVGTILKLGDSVMGGNLQMPKKTDYTMYFRLTSNNNVVESKDYDVKAEINAKHDFYPNMLIGMLEGPSDGRLVWAMLDNGMSFGYMSATFQYLMKTTKTMQGDNPNFALVYEDENWAIFDIVGYAERTRLEADYYIDEERGDYIHFKVELNGKLSDEGVKELAEKIKDNFSFTVVNDPEIHEMIWHSPFIKLNAQDEKIQLGDNCVVDMQDKAVRAWAGSVSGYLGAGYATTGKVNMLQWYDKAWKDAGEQINLKEYTGAAAYVADIEKANVGSQIEVRDYQYNGIDVRLLFNMDPDSYFYAKGTNFMGFSFVVGDNAYLIDLGVAFGSGLTEAEVESFVAYVFDHAVKFN